MAEAPWLQKVLKKAEIDQDFSALLEANPQTALEQETGMNIQELMAQLSDEDLADIAAGKGGSDGWGTPKLNCDHAGCDFTSRDGGALALHYLFVHGEIR